MSVVDPPTSWSSWIVRVMLGAEMELLGGPLFFATCLAILVLAWRRVKDAGLFPKALNSWRELLFRIPGAIALSYSTAGIFVDVPLVSLIGLFFAILTLGLSFLAGEDRRFLQSLGWIALFVNLLLVLMRPVVV